MLGECPDDLPPAEPGSHRYFACLLVDDADGYYQDLAARGVVNTGSAGGKLTAAGDVWI